MMFRLWELAVAPVLSAAGARRVVEIGALRGETTVKLLDLLGPESEVHVIDPVPQFDPSEHERGSRAATTSIERSATTCCPSCRRSTRR